MTTKTLTTNASLYDCNGYLVMSGITVQHCTGDANRCDTIISGNTEHRADDCVIRDGEITGLGGWTLKWDAANEPTSKLILECTRTQKGNYVRAGAGRKLVDWCLEKLDAAAACKFFAAIAADKSGPAMGIGCSPEEAMEDAIEWAGDNDGLIAIEITEASYNAIAGGHPDAVTEVR